MNDRQGTNTGVLHQKQTTISRVRTFTDPGVS